MLKSHGVLPSAWGEQTPHQLFAVLFGDASKAVRPPEQLAPIDTLAKVNRDRAAKGLKPVGQLFGKVLMHVPDA